MVVGFLVDWNVPSRGHRKNLLNPQISEIGVACGFFPGSSQQNADGTTTTVNPYIRTVIQGGYNRGSLTGGTTTTTTSTGSSGMSGGGYTVNEAVEVKVTINGQDQWVAATLTNYDAANKDNPFYAKWSTTVKEGNATYITETTQNFASANIRKKSN